MEHQPSETERIFSKSATTILLLLLFLLRSAENFQKQNLSLSIRSNCVPTLGLDTVIVGFRF
jgi:hypothetical protein